MITLRCLLCALVFQGFHSFVMAQQAHEPVTDAVLTAKLYPLLHVIQQQASLQQPLLKNKQLQQIRKRQLMRAAQAKRLCVSVSCYADSLKWKEEDMVAAGDALIQLYERYDTWRKAVAAIRKQHLYPLYDTVADTALLRRAWYDAAKGINRIFDVYIKGEKPQYGAIDSISFKKGDPVFRNQVGKELQALNELPRKKPFFEGALRIALDVLRLNGRDEAARYEPLAGSYNEQPFLKIKSTDFSKFPYSMILIPGQGPEQEHIALHPNGAERCKKGAMRYRQGLAPFIVVSGGNVHPFKTPYNEAVEMKKYMIEQLGIPANAIFIEPHARHTTTNLRNTARMVYRFGIPADKPLLIVTDTAQSGYIVQRMNRIALRDLGYAPYADLKINTKEETVFYPVRAVLQPNPFDPLDP